ncbi:hypothetical protein AB833_30480 [Chromatiales bacterium (ex Bugula neritina AB1)]|nr:hypothetical protein AB833_30480 [Chromatiales bacterium (ex Bugula neritina AB1)]
MASRNTLSTGKSIVLALSLLVNIALLAGLYVLSNKFRYLYIDYRHFRSQEIGVSSATLTDSTDQTLQKIVLFGDSRIETWDPLPSLDNFSILNAGVIGETTTEMRRRFTTDVLRHTPEVVVIQAGINDLTAAATRDIPEPDALISAMHRNIEYFLSELEKSNTQVLLFSIIPTNEFNLLRKFFWSPSLGESIEASNRKLQALAAKYNAQWIDVTSDYEDENKNPRAELFADTLHINSQGYKVLNNRLTSLLK